MARARQLTDLIADVRNRTNMETSTFVTNAEITEYLNQEIAELWARLVQGSGAPHYRSLYSIAVTPAQTLYPLPGDFWQVQGVEATINSVAVMIRPFMPREHAAQSRIGTYPFPYPYSDYIRYRVQADNIEFLPATQTFTATLFYTACAPRLVNPTDTFDGFNGYEMAPIYGACATVREKEETDPSFFLSQRERLYQHIDSLAAQRDASEPERVQDVSGSGFTGWGIF